MMRVLTILAIAALLVCSGCVTTTTVERTGLPAPPKPRAARATPASATPNRMLLMVPPKPDDTDGNGFPDRLQVVAALFAEPHPMSTRVDGAFVFELYRQGEAAVRDAAPIATWRVEGEALVRAQREAIYGPCYTIPLPLAAMADRMRPTTADLRGRFELPDGTIVRASAEVRQVQLGSAFHAVDRR